MSRLWDTPEFWARSEADELLRRHADQAPDALADSIEHQQSAYDEDPLFARDIVAELHKRAEAGVRFWPDVAELPAIEAEVRAMFANSNEAGQEEPERDLETANAPGFWWQRM